MFLFSHTGSQLIMVMNYKRKTTRGAYGEETLKEALSKLDTKSMKSVSKEYGIPRKTLDTKTSQKCSS